MATKKTSGDELQKMQNDAILRVREMHLRSKAPKEEQKNPPTNFNLRNTKILKPPAPTKTQKSTSRRQFGTMSGFMDLIFSGGDKTLLIVLIILLMDNEENFGVVMILLYLLL